MKFGKFSLFIALILALTFAMCSCSMADGDGGGYYGGAFAPDSDMKSEGADGSPSDSVDDEGSEGETEDNKAEEIKPITKPAGLITAGAWNDNDNYGYWKQLFEQNETESGKFYSYSGENSWGFTSYNRIKVTVKNGENSVAGATVVAKSADGTEIFSAITDSCGVAYLFTDESSGTVVASSADYTASMEFTSEARELAIDLEGSAEKKNIIDLMFLIDVTGSMGDELEYLKNEIADVINRVSANDKETVINLALLFYRDHGDKEVFKYHDFVNVTEASGLAEVQAALESQKATGGGDFPEAVDEALMLAVEKQWNTSATTKIIFHILDAPPHSTDTNKETTKAAVNMAAEKGIRLCPILCSGADILTEYLMRQAAIYTGGTFIFITDDSGIGGAHHDPGLPNVTVEALNSLMVRLIGGYHTGTFADPVDWRQEQSAS